MLKMSTPPSFAHAFDVANNVAVFESCLRKNLVVAFTYEIFNVWLIDNVVANQCDEQREQENVERLKKEPPLPAAQGITGRRQTEWTGATQCPGSWTRPSNEPESLITR
jgi:hypothetical protein